MPEEDQELTSSQEQNMHRNAQATSVLLSALSPEEFNKVDGLEEAKQIWDTLQVAHEGTTSVRESKIELLEGKLGRFVMEDDETPQAMYDRMMVLVNKIRGLGSEEIDDHKVVKRLLRAFAPRNPTLVTLIRERRDYKRLTPSDVLGRILAHELMEEEANEVKIHAKQSSTSKNKEVAFKASKSKQVQESSSSEDESSEDEEMAFFVKRFKKFMRKGGYIKVQERHAQEENIQEGML